MRKSIVAGVVVVLVVLAVWMSWRLVKGPIERRQIGEIEKVREITLYFGSEDASSFAQEYREIASSDKTLDNLRRVIGELISGPTGDAIPTLPSSIRLLGVYIHDKTAYIDFSQDIVDDFSGGTAAEYMLVGSIVQTACANFPDIEAVGILVGGESVDTIGGHLFISKPLRPQDWR